AQPKPCGVCRQASSAQRCYRLAQRCCRRRPCRQCRATARRAQGAASIGRDTDPTRSRIREFQTAPGKFFPRRQPQVANIGLTKRAFVALSGAWTGAKTRPSGSASAKMPRNLGRKPAFCPCVTQSDARKSVWPAERATAFCAKTNQRENAK